MQKQDIHIPIRICELKVVAEIVNQVQYIRQFYPFMGRKRLVWRDLPQTDHTKPIDDLFLDFR
jgi:hypothetical protein